jgi:hypothetical protein
MRNKLLPEGCPYYCCQWLSVSRPYRYHQITYLKSVFHLLLLKCHGGYSASPLPVEECLPDDICPGKPNNLFHRDTHYIATGITIDISVQLMEDTMGHGLYGLSVHQRSGWPVGPRLQFLARPCDDGYLLSSLAYFGLGRTIHDTCGSGPWEQCYVCFLTCLANITTWSGLSLRAMLLGKCVWWCMTTSG